MEAYITSLRRAATHTAVVDMASHARAHAIQCALSRRHRTRASAWRRTAALANSALVPSPDVDDVVTIAPSPDDDVVTRRCALVAFVPYEKDSYLHYPEGIDGARFERAAPSYGEVWEHVARRVAWTDSTLSMEVVSHDASAADMARAAMNADVFVVIGCDDASVAKKIREACAGTPTGVALDSPALAGEDRVCYQPMDGLKAMEAKLIPWSQAARDVRSIDMVKDLFERKNHTDLYFMHLVLASASGIDVAAVDISQDITLGNVWCIGKNCNKQLRACYGNPMCKKSLDCVDACGLNDQVCTYQCIRSYENDEFEKLARCMLHSHNCLGNNAVRPEFPRVSPMQTFRGEPLTHSMAERILQGWFGPKKYSWIAVAGNNDAFDAFPNQYQIWYPGKAKNSFWYNPVFRVNTLDGRTVWRRSDYRCRREDAPGTFTFSFMDNGVTSQEYWRIVDAADDLSWSLYYYSGAAKSAGQAYIGAILATPDGLWPADDQLDRIADSLWRGCGIKIWEMIQVDNSNGEDAPLIPLHEVVLADSLVVSVPGG